MKLCKDCKWCQIEACDPEWASWCNAPDVRTSPVTGADCGPGYCDTERGIDGRCGPKAVLFEPRQDLN